MRRSPPVGRPQVGAAPAGAGGPGGEGGRALGGEGSPVGGRRWARARGAASWGGRRRKKKKNRKGDQDGNASRRRRRTTHQLAGGGEYIESIHRARASGIGRLIPVRPAGRLTVGTGPEPGAGRRSRSSYRWTGTLGTAGTAARLSPAVLYRPSWFPRPLSSWRVRSGCWQAPASRPGGRHGQCTAAPGRSHISAYPSAYICVWESVCVHPHPHPHRHVYALIRI